MAVVEVKHVVGRHREGYVQAGKQACLPAQPREAHSFVEVVGAHGVDHRRIGVGDRLVGEGAGRPHVEAHTQGGLQALVGDLVLDKRAEFARTRLPNVVRRTD